MQFKKVKLYDDSYIDAYIAEQTEKYTRKAILVIPGGGYAGLSDNREGEQIALAFMPYGYNAFVLHYSVDGKKVFPAQLIQASAAIQHIRDNAVEYGVYADELFAVGFSAGGHLAACLATMWNKKEIYEAIDMPLGYNKPKGAMLIYPVISGISEWSHTGSINNLLGTKNPTPEQRKSVSIECNVTDEAVPLYIVHSEGDDVVPVQNSLLIAGEYADRKLPFEMHIYPRGIHGFALGNAITGEQNQGSYEYGLSDWVKNAVRWAENIK